MPFKIGLKRLKIMFGISASSYEFRYIIDNVTQLRDNFESCPLIDVEDLYNFTNPAAAGVEEYVLLDPPMSENKTYVL